MFRQRSAPWNVNDPSCEASSSFIRLTVNTSAGCRAAASFLRKKYGDSKSISGKDKIILSYKGETEWKQNHGTPYPPGCYAERSGIYFNTNLNSIEKSNSHFNVCEINPNPPATTTATRTTATTTTMYKPCHMALFPSKQPSVRKKVYDGVPHTCTATNSKGTAGEDQGADECSMRQYYCCNFYNASQGCDPTNQIARCKDERNPLPCRNEYDDKKGKLGEMCSQEFNSDNSCFGAARRFMCCPDELQTTAAGPATTTTATATAATTTMQQWAKVPNKYCGDPYTFNSIARTMPSADACRGACAAIDGCTIASYYGNPPSGTGIRKNACALTSNCNMYTVPESNVCFGAGCTGQPTNAVLYFRPGNEPTTTTTAVSTTTADPKSKVQVLRT